MAQPFFCAVGHGWLECVAICFLYCYCPTASLAGIEMCIRNWQRMPASLFGKAWMITGHITKEDLLACSNITEEDLLKASLLQDPLRLSQILGCGNEDEPSLGDLAKEGELFRSRAVWLLDGPAGSDIQALLPGVLVFPVEKKLCNFLNAKTRNLNARQLPSKWSTVVMSKRTGREPGHETIRKHTNVARDNRKWLKEDVPPRTQYFINLFYSCSRWRN